ncbi:MAG: extracellular solute-binding protein, partial [Gemmatimonadota bacterium]
DGGDGGGTTTTSKSQSRGDADLRNEYGLPELDYELEKTLNVFQWTDYWPQGTVEKFEKAYGVKVNVSNYASNEEMFNKLKAGGTGQYDLIFPSDYMINILVKQGMIRKLDTGKIPNLENLAEKFSDTPYDPNPGTYSAPYQWGTSGIAYNANMLGEDE